MARRSADERGTAATDVVVIGVNDHSARREQSIELVGGRPTMDAREAAVAETGFFSGSNSWKNM